MSLTVIFMFLFVFKYLLSITAIQTGISQYKISLIAENMFSWKKSIFWLIFLVKRPFCGFADVLSLSFHIGCFALITRRLTASIDLSKVKIETLEKGLNMFRVNNKNVTDVVLMFLLLTFNISHILLLLFILLGINR